MLTHRRTLLLILAALLLAVSLLFIRRPPDTSKPWPLTMTTAILAHRLGLGGEWSEGVFKRWCAAEADPIVSAVLADMAREVEERRRHDVEDLANVERSP